MENVYICENCGKEHIIKYGSGRFCCSSCRVSFTNKHRKRKQLSEETKQKLSNHFSKPHFCKICGKEYKYTKSNKTIFCCNKCKKINNYINTLIKYFNFDISVLKTDKVFNEIERIKNELTELYWVNELPIQDIADIYNYPSPCNLTGKIFIYLGIPTRNCKDTNKLNIIKGKNYIPINTKYKHGWHTTWNNKKVYYRSQNELDYAIELDNLKIDYEMESLRIKYFDTKLNEYRCAIPDFYIPSKNEIVEIKSSYTLDIQNMKDKFKSYKDFGYNCKCICDYKEIKIL